MAFTDISRVKALLNITSTGENTVLQYYVDSVSRKVEGYINNYALETGRTEYYNVEPYQKSLTLRCAPVASITSIHDDVDWTFGSDSLISSTDYRLDSVNGQVYFKTDLVGGPQSVQVIYTGGLGTDYSDVIANGFEDLVLAVDQQIVYEYKRRDTEDLNSYSDAAGNVSVAAPLTWLPHVREVLDRYRRF